MSVYTVCHLWLSWNSCIQFRAVFFYIVLSLIKRTLELSILSTVCSLQSTVYSLKSTIYSLQSTVCSLQFTFYSLQSSVYSLQSTVHSLQSTVYSLVYSLQSAVPLMKFFDNCISYLKKECKVQKSSKSRSFGRSLRRILDRRFVLNINNTFKRK